MTGPCETCPFAGCACEWQWPEPVAPQRDDSRHEPQSGTMGGTDKAAPAGAGNTCEGLATSALDHLNDQEGAVT